MVRESGTAGNLGHAKENFSVVRSSGLPEGRLTSTWPFDHLDVTPIYKEKSWLIHALLLTILAAQI